MSYGNSNQNFTGSDIAKWIFIIAMLAFCWPVGLFLLIRELKNSGKTVSKTKTTTTTTTTTKTSSYYSGRPDFSAYQSPNVTGTRYHAEQTTHRSSDFAPKKEEPVSASRPSKKKAEAVGATALFAAAVLFLIIGLAYLFDGIGSSFRDVLIGLFFLVGGGASVATRYAIKRRARRLNKYLNVMGTDDCKSVKEIADATGLSRTQVQKDLEYMAERGFFGEDAYFDNGLNSIVTSQEAAEKERAIRMAEKQQEKQKETREEYTSEYMRAYEEMRSAAAAVQDVAISEKGMRLAELTGKILQAAEEHPEKGTAIRRFTDYYLPSALKLLRSYSTMEKQGVSGQNITATKEKINGILDTLIVGYEKQLDQMFNRDALDISSDIDVLETMMKQDGLSDEGTVMGGH